MKSKNSTGRAGLPVSGALTKGIASKGGTPRTPAPVNTRIDSVSEHAGAGADLQAGRVSVTGDTLPPHSDEAERGLLGCILLEPGILDKLPTISPSVFFDLRNQSVFVAMAELKMDLVVIDTISLGERLKKNKRLDAVGGHAYLNDLQDGTPSAGNWPYYFDIVTEKHRLRRLTQICSEIGARAFAHRGDVNELFRELAENTDRLAKKNMTGRARLKVWTVNELMTYEFPPHLALVGDNEITMGYDGLAIIAGPGSSGKSLAALSLAIAGATGESHWMGRKIHRAFKTLIIQAENGARRLREDLEGYITSNPQHAETITASVFISDPPEGGLCFNNPEFRAAVRRQIEELKPDLVQIDPWQSVASEDAAKEVIEMLNLIRSCYPSGDACPGTIIVAHTNKPRADVVRTGRNLVYNISGSVALVNTARCVYVLLPWTAELEDHRIYWACVKLNNGKMYAPSVWLRRKGAPFLHDGNTDPTQFGKTDEDERQAITEDELRSCFDKVAELRQADIARALKAKFKHAESTSYRATGEDGYLRRYLMRSVSVKLKLKEP